MRRLVIDACVFVMLKSGDVRSVYGIGGLWFLIAMVISLCTLVCLVFVERVS